MKVRLHRHFRTSDRVNLAIPILEDCGGKRLCMAEGLPQVRKEVSAQSYFLLCSPAKFGFLEVLASYQIIVVSVLSTRSVCLLSDCKIRLLFI